MLNTLAVWAIISLAVPARDTTPNTHVFLPTSAAIDLARAVAEGEGYSLANPHRYYFDVLRTSDGAPVYPGYTTVEFVWDGSHVNSISIDEETFQTIDLTACVAFDYPVVRRLRKDMLGTKSSASMNSGNARARRECGAALKVRR